MATKKSNIVNKKNSNGTTTLICGNCGAELVIPQNSSFVAGIAIGKDSGLGTIVAPVVNGGTHHCHTPVNLTPEMIAQNPDLINLVASVMDTIEQGGYLDIAPIVSRWKPSQFLAMFYSGDGFHKRLSWKGYDYSWKVLVNDLKKQAKLFKEQDTEGLADRKRFYNKNVAFLMAAHFIESLEAYIKTLKQRSHEGRMYVKLRCPLNYYQGVHVDEIAAFIADLWTRANKIKKASNPKTVFETVESFNDYRRSIMFSPDKMSNAFLNTYKAAGAYYTLKDLIIFEGCKMKVDNNGSTAECGYYRDTRHFIDTEASLQALEDKMAAVVAADVTEAGYEMLGLARDFLNYNNFNYAATLESWKKQSELRRMARTLNKTRRPRK